MATAVEDFVADLEQKIDERLDAQESGEQVVEAATEAVANQESATPPEKVDAERHLARIEDIEVAVGELEVAMNLAKAAAKLAKEEYDEGVLRLRSMIRARKNDANRPLLNATIAAEIELKADDSWRERPLSDLGLTESLIDKLNEASIISLGQLQDYTRDHDGLNGIKGVGSAAQEKVSDAMDKFWAEHPEYCTAAGVEVAT